MTNRIKKALRASTLALIGLPAFSAIPVYAQSPIPAPRADLEGLRTLDEIYARSQSRESARAEAEARVKIAQIRADAAYKLEQLKIEQENLKAEHGSQNILDHATIAIQAIEAQARVEIEKIKIELETTRIADASARDQRQADLKARQIENQATTDLRKEEFAKEVSIEKTKAEAAIRQAEIEAAREKARLDAEAKARKEYYDYLKQLNEARRVLYNRAETIRVGRIAAADQYNHRFFRKLREAGQASDRLYFANQANTERSQIVGELEAGLIH